MSAAAAASKVSILIPTYNQERLLGRAIAGALEQDYPNLEVIVADDASNDGTPRVARRWAGDPRLRYVRHERNLGRVENYRRLLYELAQGDWALMLDGDDFLVDPSFVSRALAAIAQHADRPIVFAQAGQRVHDLRGMRGDVDTLPPIEGDQRILVGGDYLRFVFQTGFFTHLGTLFDRRAAMRNGFYRADLSSSDMESLLRLALEGEVLLLKTIAGCWVQHESNTSCLVPVAQIAPNVRIFRDVAREAVCRGLTTWPKLRGPLRRYEAATLTALFVRAVKRSKAVGPQDFVKLLAVARAINPGLFTDRLFLSRCLHLLGRVAGSAIARIPGMGQVFKSRTQRPAQK